MPEYSDGFKAKMVQRLAGPRAITAAALSRETGIPQPTLSAWLRQAGTPRPRMPTTVEGTTASAGDETAVADARSPKDKLRLVVAVGGLASDEVGGFLRREGVLQADLDDWTATMLGALAAPRVPTVSGSREVDSRRVLRLERELARKDQALAEAAALLVLQKKFRDYLGDVDANTPRRSAR